MLASNPPTFICAVAPKMMPWVLIRKIWPFELMRPKIWLGFWSRMRFRATAERPGWLNSTDSLAPTLKVCQFSASFCDAWLMTVLFPLWMIEPVPPTTTPPVGPPASASPLKTIDPTANPTHRLIGQVLRKGKALPDAWIERAHTLVRDLRWWVLLLMVVIRQNVKLKRE